VKELIHFTAILGRHFEGTGRPEIAMEIARLFWERYNNAFLEIFKEIKEQVEEQEKNAQR
jgi:hypothetical protein